MPGFDFSEYDDGEAAVTKAAESVVVQFQEANPEPPQNYMLEVDKRLAIASAYRILLNNDLFSESNDECKVVQDEVREFVISRLEVLLSIRAVTASIGVQGQDTQTFTEEEAKALKILAELSINEIKALKILAAKCLAGLNLQPEPSKKPQPTVNKVAPPAAKPIQPAQAPQAVKPRVGRPPGKANEPPKPLFIESETDRINPETGEPFKIKNKRVQRPAGAVPFPSSNQAMQMASEMAAQRGSEVNTAHIEKRFNQIDETVVVK